MCVSNPVRCIHSLRIPLTEFLHKNVDAECVLGKEIRAVNEELKDASDYESLFAIVEGYLWEKIRRIKEDHHPFEKIGRLIQDNPQSFSLEKIAGQALYEFQSGSERKFLCRTGVMPKFFSRICRFHYRLLN